MTEQLREDVWLLDIGLFPPLDTNGYLVDDGEVTLVDTGLWVNRPSLRSELAEAGYTPRDLDRVLLTHYDLDHTAGLRELRPEFDGEVIIGQVDYDLYTGAYDPQWLHHKGLFHRLVRPFFPIPNDFDVRPVEDEETIGGFTAYHTPGHNPGHMAYVHESGAAFVGDLLWEDDRELRYPFWADSYSTRELRASVIDFAARAPPFEILGMGHGRPYTSGGYAALRSYAGRL